MSDDRQRTTQSFGIAIVIEVLLIVGLVSCVDHVHTEALKQQVSVIQLTEAPPEPKKPEPRKPEPTPKPESKPKVIPPKHEQPKPVEKKVEPKPVKQHVMPKPELPKPAEEKPTEVAKPTAVTQPAPPPQPAPPVESKPDPQVVNAYAAKLNAAIQAATHCPDGVEYVGHPKVGFTLHGTSVSNVHLLAGTGNDATDNAAKHAVLDANIPEPPEDLANKAHSYVVPISLSCH